LKDPAGSTALTNEHVYHPTWKGRTSHTMGRSWGNSRSF
jgi:hypothetical protein